MNSNEKISTTRIVAQIGMLGALSAVLTFLTFPLPFLAPPFYKLDFSEVPVMIGAFAMGPIPGVLIVLIKTLLKLVLKGSSSAFVGDLGSFIIGCTYILAASIIYWVGNKKSRARAAIGMAVGTVLASIMAALINVYVLLPAYSKAFHIPMEGFVEMGAAIHSSINSVTSFALLIVVPFNIFKYLVISAIVFLVYKHISVILKRN